MNYAKELGRLAGWRGDARLYRLSTPIEYTNWTDDEEEFLETSFVIVSGVNAFETGLETYIFPSDKKGKPLNMTELRGSFRGSINHEKALRGAGYEIK